MPWDRSGSCGFTTGEPWLPLGEDHAARSVEAERHDPDSMLALTRALLELRRREPALSIGTFAPLAVEEDVLVYARTWRDQRFVIALNLQSASRAIRHQELAGQVALSTRPARVGQRTGDRLELAGDEAVIIATERA
jgi:alpha-glucosidase